MGAVGDNPGKGGADPKVSRMFYIAVTQQVLLFGAESWVLTGNMEAALDAAPKRRTCCVTEM